MKYSKQNVCSSSLIHYNVQFIDKTVDFINSTDLL